MKNTRQIIREFILVLILIFVFLITAIFKSGFDLNVYEKGYDKYSIENTSGFTKQEYLDEILKYKKFLFSRNLNPLILSDNYNADEIAHMKDVWGLFRLARIVRIILILLALYFCLIFFKKKYLPNLTKFWYLFLLIPVLFSLPAFFDFEMFWEIFHRLVFNNELWLMDPESSLMIRLLPEGIFFDIVKSISFRYIIYSVIFLIVQKFLLVLKERMNGIK